MRSPSSKKFKLRIPSIKTFPDNVSNKDNQTESCKISPLEEYYQPTTKKQSNFEYSSPCATPNKQSCNSSPKKRKQLQSNSSKLLLPPKSTEEPLPSKLLHPSLDQELEESISSESDMEGEYENYVFPPRSPILLTHPWLCRPYFLSKEMIEEIFCLNLYLFNH